MSGKAAAASAHASKSGPVGGGLRARLARLGIHADADLVLHLPLRYEDETRLDTVASARPGEAAQLEVRVLDSSVQYRPRRQLVCRVSDGTGELILRFFSFYPNQTRQLVPGTLLRIFGELRGGFWGAEMVHPRFRPVQEGEPLPQALTPIYPTTGGLGQQALRRLIDRALEKVSLEETLPAEILDRLGLPGFEASVRLLHHPGPQASADLLTGRTHPAWRRVKFDELLAQQLSLRKAYAARRARSAPRLAARHTLTRELLERLPFRLTGAQERAWAEISADLASCHPMQRLLQGDVGSGKTVVAALAMLQAVENGCQAALMAPTEILAEQHYRKLASWLAPLGVGMAWLSGGMRKRDKQDLSASLESGELALAVGTHALIEEAVTFHRLGLAIVDEQHRFGVRQRLSLRQKGESAHQLMMSATPIPRTLAMSHYADLDVSVLDELPPGRTPVLTKLVSEARREEVIARVREGCRSGRQAYWVCPLIEESEQLQLKTALETYERLSAELPELRIGLVHGRLKAEDKVRVMGGFSAGTIDLLVATTVIEVGVDVANASLMVIEHAERFGLAQLHQLRGRVGRGSADSACILLYAAQLSDTARARLKIIYENQDGFEIARQDLELRGPGEFIGSRQSGTPLLRFADLSVDADLLPLAREAAVRLLRDFPATADAHLARWLGGRQELVKA